MNRTLRLLAVLLLLAVVPLRGVAAVTVGFCAMGHQPIVEHAHDASHGAHGHENGHAESDSAGSGHPPASVPDCNICAEHCTSASFVVPAPTGPLLVADGPGRIASGTIFAAGHVPEHLDPPPLAL